MRTPSKDLYLLIKSLSKGEKRNFKLQAGIVSGDKKYIQLFDKIDRQEEYDETKLMGPYSGGQFSVAKNYLYKLILRSLSHYHKGKRVDLGSKVQQVNILAEKELYEQADKLLDRCLEEARKSENFEILLHLLDQKRDILLNRSDELLRQGEEEERNRSAQWCVQALNEVQELDGLRLEIRRQASALKPRVSPAHRATLQTLFEHPLLDDAREVQSLRARVERLSLKFMLHFYCKDFEACIRNGWTILEELGDSPLFLQENAGAVSKILRNVGAIGLREHSYQLAAQCLKKLGSIKPRNKRATKAWFYRYFTMKLLYRIYSFESWDCQKVIEEYYAEKKKWRVNPSNLQESWLLYLFSYQFFLQGRYGESLRWMNKLLNNTDKRQETILLCYARLLNLLIHFELGNADYLEHEISNTQRFLQRKNELNDTVTCFLLQLRKLLQAGGMPSLEREHLLQFREVYHRTHEADQDQMLDRPILDVMSWIESRLSGQTMPEVRSVAKRELQRV